MVSVKSLNDVQGVLRAIEDPDIEVVRQLNGIDGELTRLLPRKSRCMNAIARNAWLAIASIAANPDCEDPNCGRNIADLEAEELAALKKFAASLKGLVA